MMPELDLEAIRKRLEEATDGNWELDYDEEIGSWIIMNGKEGTQEHAVAVISEYYSANGEANANFLVHSREDVKKLLRKIDHLELEVAALEEDLKDAYL